MGSKKLVYGMGINDVEYVVRPMIEGKQTVCHFYRTWCHMLERCHSKKYQDKQPTYVGCSVCEEWLTFSNFKKWMEGQDYKGKQLDKDILSLGNKQYNPTSCIFLSKSLNTLLIDCATKRGVYPLGVSWHKRVRKFSSSVAVCGKSKYLGYFTAPLEAHKAWQKAKKQIIYNVAEKQLDGRLKTALLLKCTQLQYDISNDLETFKL